MVIIEKDRYLKLTNHLLLIAKYYIYCCSINKEPLYFCTYLTIVISKAEIDKYQQGLIQMNAITINGKL